MPQLNGVGKEGKKGISGQLGRGKREKALPQGSAFLIKDEQRVGRYVLSWSPGLNGGYGRSMPVSLILFSRVL